MNCYIRDCPNHSGMSVEGLCFLEFPQDPLKNKAWTDAIGQHYTDHPKPTPDTKICNGHFFRKNTDTQNPEHPSYKPLFFPSMTKEAIKELRKSCKERLSASEDSETTPQTSILKREASEMPPPPAPPPCKKARPLPPKCYRKITSKERYCCVVGCYNNTSNKVLEFLRFPNKSSEQFKAWVRRIGRANPDGSLWMPNYDSIICSDHFYGGDVSNTSNIFSTSYAPAFFPHNIDCWDEIQAKLNALKENHRPTYIDSEPSEDDLSNVDCYYLEHEKVTLTYPSLLSDISEYILECQQEKKFTDVVISNGQHSFEGHRIILMSALPMIKIALLNLEGYEMDEKPVILIPGMSSYEIDTLEKVIYSRGSLTSSQHQVSRHLSNLSDSKQNSRDKMSEQCPISEAVAEKVKKAAFEKKKVLAPIPVLKLDSNKITSNDFFRLYNNVACRAAKNEALHQTFKSNPSPAETNVIDTSPELKEEEMFEEMDEAELRNASGEVMVSNDGAAEGGEKKGKPILDKIVKQVTSMRAVSPQKFTIKNNNKKYTVIMQTVKRPDPSSKPFPSLEELKARRNERPSKPYCSACEKEFETIEERDQHKVSHLSEADQYPNSRCCKHCLKSFKTVEQKRIHETNHTKMGWKCDICEKGFPSAHRLLDHSFTHKTTSRFVCQFCSKGFRIKSKLLLHENMHRNISKHKCKYCLRLFVSARSLNDHLNFHEGVRPYVCDKCGKSFSTSPSLSQHRSRVHNRREVALGRYKCLYCSKRFRYKPVVNNHMEHCESRPPVTILHIDV